MSKIITGLFHEVFGHPYMHGNPEHRISIQKNTYLLEKLGLDMGDFWFLWDSYGPFSLELRSVIVGELDSPDEDISYSQFAKNQIESMRLILDKGKALEQEPRQWLEIICSLHYLKNYVVANGDVISTMIERKPHFNNDVVNATAFAIVNTIDDLGCYDDSNNKS